jgi:tricarballylate dehydrogenase
MNRTPQKLVIIGHGAAGLAAAVSAAEEARSRDLLLDITLLEKSREDQAGGNTRWSPSYMRLAAPDRLAPGFEDDMHQVSGGLADRNYFRTLAESATATIGWLQTHGVAFDTPVYYLSAGPPRIQPVGGGRAIVDKLAEAAGRAGVKLRYQSQATGLVTEGRCQYSIPRSRHNG